MSECWSELELESTKKISEVRKVERRRGTREIDQQRRYEVYGSLYSLMISSMKRWWNCLFCMLLVLVLGVVGVGLVKWCEPVPTNRWSKETAENKKKIQSNHIHGNREQAVA